MLLWEPKRALQLHSCPINQNRSGVSGTFLDHEPHCFGTERVERDLGAMAHKLVLALAARARLLVLLLFFGRADDDSVGWSHCRD